MKCSPSSVGWPCIAGQFGIALLSSGLPIRYDPANSRDTTTPPEDTAANHAAFRQVRGG